MPSKAPRICSHPGCSNLTHGRYCAEHSAVVSESSADSQSKYNAKRPESDKLYKSVKWRKLSIHYRKKHPLCCACKEAGEVRASQVVDHIQPAKLRPDLFFEWSNLRALCHQCHNRIGERVVSSPDEAGAVKKFPNIDTLERSV